MNHALLSARLRPIIVSVPLRDGGHLGGVLGQSPNFCGGQYLKHALPRMFSFGSGPQMCESNELFLLSPIDEHVSGGHHLRVHVVVAGSSLSSLPRDVTVDVQLALLHLHRVPGHRHDALDEHLLRQRRRRLGVFGGWR